MDRTLDMPIEIRQESAAVLAEYGRIPIAFAVDEIYEVATEADSRFSRVPVA
jgi:hypothetical protein